MAGLCSFNGDTGGKAGIIKKFTTGIQSSLSKNKVVCVKLFFPCYQMCVFSDFRKVFSFLTLKIWFTILLSRCKTIPSNPLTLRGDQHVISPYNIYTSSSKQVMRIVKLSSCSLDLTPNSYNLLTRKCLTTRWENEQSDVGSYRVKYVKRIWYDIYTKITSPFDKFV